MEIFEIGGCVRDEILGVRSKDIDFSVVLSDSDVEYIQNFTVGLTAYDFMVGRLEREFSVKVIRDNNGVPVGAEFLTVRGIHPERGAVDFVLARKEGDYSDGRRPDKVEVGTLADDIFRRDFSMNALAKDSEGNVIDMVGGVQDINDRVIRAVGSAFDRLTEDALRAVRALRFSVTKDFRIDKDVEFAMQSAAVLDAISSKISDERIMDELNKMLKFDTLKSLTAFQRYPALTNAMFTGKVSLEATMKQKGRGR